MARKPSYDLQLVRDAAAGRWAEILSHMGGISADFLDGRHHECPKCGGTDRFRLIDAKAGALLCNQCFASKNGDGFAALGWLCGWSFQESLTRVADHLGIAPEKRSCKRDPASHLDWIPWSDLLAARWCEIKQPITSAAVQRCGGRMAMYYGQYVVIALPIHGQTGVVGWVLYNTSGRELPVYDKNGQVTNWVKVKTTGGSDTGILGPVEECKSATHVWKTEGPSDLLALLSLDPPTGHTAVCNAAGCKEDPFGVGWALDLFAGHVCYVVHDCDRPGQEGAMGVPRSDGQVRPGWCQAIATKASETRNVVLPYPISETHGEDLRDWIRDGHGYQDLVDLAATCPPIATTAAQPLPVEADDDPHRLARVNLQRYARHRDGATLRYWRDEWYTWKPSRGCYQRISEKELRAKVTAAIKEEFDRLSVQAQMDGEENTTAKKVTVTTVTNTLAAMAGMVVVPNTVDQMTWLDGENRERRNYIALRNGILDVDALMSDHEDVLLPHSPNWFSEVCLPYEFNIDAECPKWLAFLRRNLEGDFQRINVLQEWAGYLLLPDTGEQVFLMLEGEGANGKSVYCAAIAAMLGGPNCSHIPLELFGDRFAKSQTLGKLVNICADVGELDKVAEGYLKSFTSGDAMFFDRKGVDGINCTPTARLMIACNNRPRINDRSQGVWRRLKIIPWLVQIGPDERIKNMDKAWWWEQSGELPGILNWALVGLYRLKQQLGFTITDLGQKASDDYQHEVNPARSFLAEHLEQVSNPESKVKTVDVYKFYSLWCQENGYRPLNERHFAKEISRVFPESKRKKLGPKAYRYWCYDHLIFSCDEICGKKTYEASEF